MNLEERAKELDSFRKELLAEAKGKKERAILIKKIKRVRDLIAKSNISKEVAETASWCINNSEAGGYLSSLDKHWEEQTKEYKRLSNEIIYQSEDLSIFCSENGIKIPQILENKIEPQKFLMKKTDREADFPITYINIPSLFEPYLTERIFFLRKVSKKDNNHWVEIEDKFKKEKILVIPAGYYVLYSMPSKEFYFPAIWLKEWIPLSEKLQESKISLEDFTTSFNDVINIKDKRRNKR